MLQVWSFAIMEKSLISDIPVNTLVNEDFNLDESMLRLYNAVLCWLQKKPKKPKTKEHFIPSKSPQLRKYSKDKKCL